MPDSIPTLTPTTLRSFTFITRQYRQIEEYCNEISHNCNSSNSNLFFVIILSTIKCYRVWVTNRGVKGTTHTHTYVYIYIFLDCVNSWQTCWTDDRNPPLQRQGPSKTSPLFEPKAIFLLYEVFVQLKMSQKHFPDSYQRCSEIGIHEKMRAKKSRSMSKCSS